MTQFRCVRHLALRLHVIRAACLLGLLFGQAASAQLASSVVVDQADSRVQTQFVRANALLRDGQWREAVEAIRSLSELSGEQLVQVPNSPTAEALGFANFVTLRQRAHHWFAALSQEAPQALEVYRRQIDPLAERFYVEGAQRHDEQLLQRIVDEMFASRFGDDALLRLGELARQRGACTLARSYWQRIASPLRHVDGDAYPWWLMPAENGDSLAAPRGASSSWLAFPDSDLDLNEIRARLALVSIQAGQAERARRELDQFRRISPDSEGMIAGRSGKHVDLLAGLLAASGDWSAQHAADVWPTFAGSPQRSRSLTTPIEIGPRPQWRRMLPRLRLQDATPATSPLRVGESSSGLLSVFPVAAGGLAVYATGLQIEDLEAIELQTGRLAFPRRSHVSDQEVPHLPGATSVPRMTLTVQGTTLFALVLDRRGLPGRLVAVDLAAERKLIFAVELDEFDWSGSWIFEGAPVADSQSLYVAVRRIDQLRHASYVACFGSDDGSLRWRRLICEAETEPSIASGYLSNLLTLEQQTIYFNTNLGAVAALRADDGSLRWLLTYPRVAPRAASAEGGSDLYRFRDLTPCLVHNDMIIAAPRDANRIFAVDAISGALLWSLHPGVAADAVHLLGVAGNRLIASGECLYWIDLLTGRLQARFPGTFHAGDGYARPDPRGHGRGLLAGGELYWPTREAIYVFDQQTVKTDWGWQPRLLRRIELAARGAAGGNLLLHDDVLLIASADYLYAFRQLGNPQHADHRPASR